MTIWLFVAFLRMHTTKSKDTRKLIFGMFVQLLVSFTYQLQGKNYFLVQGSNDYSKLPHFHLKTNFRSFLSAI